MKQKKGKRRYGTLVAIAALVSTSACESRQRAITDQENPTMNQPPTLSRPAPPDIQPVEHKGIRYIQDRTDSSLDDQNGGYLAAIDANTEEQLWRLEVYEVPDYSADGVDNIGRYFRSMVLIPERDQIEIENESGGRYVVDLVARTSTQVGGPPPGPETPPPAKPKPKPKPGT